MKTNIFQKHNLKYSFIIFVDARLVERSCKSYCLNGGTCSVGNVENISCFCQKGFYGKRCETNGTSYFHLNTFFYYRK